jgi:hypothetical protein
MHLSHFCNIRNEHRFSHRGVLVTDNSFQLLCDYSAVATYDAQ